MKDDFEALPAKLKNDFEALRAKLKFLIRIRGEEATEPAIAAEAIKLDPQANVVGEKLYPTLTSILRKNGLTFGGIVHAHLKKGETVQQMLDAILGKGVIVYGLSYRSNYAALKALGHEGIHRRVYARMGDGLSLEEALEDVLNRRAGPSPHSVVLFGETYPNKPAACKARGVIHGSVMWRVKELKETFEQAVSALIERRFLVDEEWYPSVSAAAIAKGVPSGTVFSRIRNLKETPQQAIDAIRNKPTRGYLVDGESYSSELKLAKAFGVSQSCINRRLSKGLSAQQTIDELRETSG